MRYDTRFRGAASMFNWSFPPGVKWLVISNVVIFLISFFGGKRLEDLFIPLELIPSMVLHLGFIWQPVTYLFLHGGVGHVVFNMLALWMFGAMLEQTWGTKRFLQYYFVCGIGAGICVVIVNALVGNENQPTIGASGAIYGLLLAFGMMFPNQTVLMDFLFPIKAKYLVMIVGAVAFINSFQGGSTVSNLAHLGGLIFGFIYMKTQFGRRRTVPNVRLDLGQRWKEYKLQRARRRFKVYMKKHGSDRDPWVN